MRLPRRLFKRAAKYCPGGRNGLLSGAAKSRPPAGTTAPPTKPRHRTNEARHF